MKLLAILSILSLLAVCKGLRFNKPRILLPLLSEVRVNYTLEVLEKGCFNFRVSSGSELIQIQPIFEDDSDCAYKVQITSISLEKTRKTATILAESQDTGEVLRCFVILDLIYTFGVHTTTRELFLEEAPETFELKAQDNQGNDFTSLEGIEFNWKIGLQSLNTRDQSGQARQQVLRFLTFSESKYHTVPKDVEKFETLGKKGHMILLDGINSGSAKVNVKLPYAEYSHIPEVEVEITVLANLIIDPIEANILVGDSINFRVLQLKQGKLYEITLGAQYYLEIVNTKHANIDGGLVTGLSLGTTEVLLRDSNVIENSVKTIMPKARLNVVEVDKITLNLLPHYNWVTVVNEKHDIAIDLYTKTDERITLGSKYQINSLFDASLFKELKRTYNGSRIHGVATKPGTNQVSGSYLNLIANAEMLIFSQLELTPRLVVLPFDVNKAVNQKIQFKATGGDGSFAFSTSNPNMLSITQTGLSESHLDRLKDVHYDVKGSSIVIATTVKAAMLRNPKVFKTADVFFLPPVKLQIVGFNLETAVNGYIDVHVALFALHKKEFLPFSACENLQFDVEFSNQIFTIVSMDSDQTKANNACRLIRLKGIRTGSSSVKISYRFGEELLHDDVQLLVYDQLIVLNPESNVIVLPIGSSRNVVYQNGPRKSYSVGSELIKRVRFNKEIVDANEIQSEYQEQRFAYKFLCLKVGDSKVTLEIYNSLNQENFIKNLAVVETTVHCVKPRFINLLSLDKLKASCPIDSKSSLLHVRSMQDALDIEIEVLDHQNRKLQNITSLFIDLIFSQPSGAINHKIVYNRESETDDIDGVALPKRDFVRTSMTEDANYKIKAIVKDYEIGILKDLNIQPEVPVFGIPKSTGSNELLTPLIENELDFLSFDSSLLPVASVSLFLAPGLSQRIRLGQGSGHYEIKVKNPSLLEIRHDKSSSELVLVLVAKQIGDTVVEIADRCLKTEPSRLEVSIVSVGRVEISAPDRVEKSKSIEAIVKLVDSNNHLIDIDYTNLDVYQLSEKIFSERILSMKRGHQENLQRGEIRYYITGNELGETKVVVSVSGSVSSTANVQVFPPLQLIPRNATILIGSTLEITSGGGPKPDSNIVYQIVNGDVLSIDGSVVEGLKIGKTKVIGRSIGINPADGNTITFSEDSIFITVIPLRSIKIRTPLQRLKSGNVMPVTIWAEPDVSPMILGTLKKLKIRWSIDAPEVIELKDVFEDLGIIYGEEDSLSMRVRGLKQGKARITARVLHESSKFQATVDVAVFKTLELESPKRIVHDPIIIPPKTSLQLKVNMDETIFEMNEQADSSSVINVSRDGIVKTFDMLGTSLVVASCNDQKLDIPVDVKTVHYIMATVVPSVQMKGVEKHLQRDLNFILSLSLHDNLGNEFSHNFEDVKWKSSDKNSVEVRAGDNFTVSVRLLRESSNVLAIGSRDASGLKYPEDYLKLSVKAPAGIFSRKLIVTTGDLICFESPLSDGFPWQSFNSDVLLMHGSVGRVLTVSANQKLSVQNGEKNGIHIEYELDVRQADSLQFQKNFDVFNGVSYRGFFTVSNHQQVDKLTNLIANNQTRCEDLQDNFSIDFVTCKLTSLDDGEILKKFETSSVFDKSAGSYACEIRALSSLEEITSISRSKTINFQLEARLASGILDKTDLKLTPAVQISPRIITTDKIDQQDIIIIGMENILQKVEIASSHPEFLTLIPLPKSSGRLQYKLRLQNMAAVDSELFVTVNSPLTHQNIRIPLVPPSVAELRDQTGDWVVTLMSNIGKIIAICVLVLTSIAITLMFQKNRDLDTSGVFQTQRNMQQNPNQTLINNNSSNMFTASPLQSQRTNSSPIKLSPTIEQQPIYGDPTIPSPYRRYHKRTL